MHWSQGIHKVNTGIHKSMASINIINSTLMNWEYAFADTLLCACAYTYRPAVRAHVNYKCKDPATR